MEILKYKKEEIKVFEKALSTIIDDLESLYQIGALKKISVFAPLPGFSKCDPTYTQQNWRLIIDNHGIYLIQEAENQNHSYHFAKRNAQGKIKKYLTINEQDIIFLNNYDQIRQNITRKIERAIEQKNGNLNQAKKLTRQYEKEATIEIELPETMNKHTIEVTEESGKKIGTISFGGISLKIITDANIEFKNKKIDAYKIKRK